MSATAIRNEDVYDATLKAVIVYDHFEGAAETNALLEDAARRIALGEHWDVNPWRLDVLQFQPAAQAALVEAADAHLMVFALRSLDSLPVWLVDWLEAWVAVREVHDVALAVLGGGNKDAFASSAIGELREFARRHDLGFIFDDGQAIADEADHILGHLHERQVTVTPTLRQILEQSEHNYYPHWGLNE